jgi:hypothetical protein
MVSGTVNSTTGIFQKIKVNPFTQDIINEPREVTTSESVKGLNELALQKLLKAFALLEEKPLPRGLIQPPKAQLVISQNRGYGKSHLLGLLFQKLDDHATEIYIRPFQNPGKAWHSILLTTIQELGRPDNPGEESDTNPLQIDAFARGVLAHLAADYIDQGYVSDYDPNIAREAVRLLREHPLEVFRITSEYREWAEWIKSVFEDQKAFSNLRTTLQRRLSSQLGINGRETAWLKVLYAYAYSPKGSNSREAALKWLRAEALEDDELALLKLTTADNQANGEMDAADLNELSFARLQGLCALAGFYRPFLFCFDQTEYYSSDERLVKIFGHTIQKLFAEFRNHLTVVTANQKNWEKDLKPLIEPPNQDRFSSPILLQGINEDQSRELIRKRLDNVQLDYRQVEEFCGNGWFEKQFEHGYPSVRQIINAAAARFQALQTGTVVPPNPPPLKDQLEDLLKIKIHEIESKRALQAYNQDILMWWTQELAKDATPWTVSKFTIGKYFDTQWQTTGRCTYFAFEGGDNSQRWQAIAKESIRLAKGAVATQSIILRTPDLPKLPKPSWKKIKAVIDEAQSHGLRIIPLTSDQVCEIYAARELFSDAYQGNIDYKPVDVLNWLRKKLKKQILELVKLDDGPKPDPVTLTAEQVKAAIEFIQKKRFVAIEAVLKQLNAASEARELRQTVLNAISSNPNIKAHSGPKTIILQWRAQVSQ